MEAGAESTSSVPVIIDDIKNYDGFQMSRCSYFSIECDAPTTGWSLTLEKRDIPFYLLGISGVIWKPFGKDKIFHNVKLIEETFDAIEKDPSLFVDTNDIWLPNFLFEGKSHERKMVYRVSNRVFLEAYEFRQERISEKRFLENCRKFSDDVEFSEQETASFSSWTAKQIEEAKTRFPKDKDLKLEWE